MRKLIPLIVKNENKHTEDLPMTESTTFPKFQAYDIIEASHNGEGNAAANHSLLKPADRFVKRHIGPRSHDFTKMLAALNL